MTKKPTKAIKTGKHQTFTLADTITAETVTPNTADSKPLEGELLPLTTEPVKEPLQPLKGKQQAFVDAYLIDPNATQAAITAGYSPKTATVIGAQNLIKLNIKAEIDKAMALRAEKTGITAERVVREIALHAFSDVRKLFDKDDNLIPITELDDATAASVSSIEVVAAKGQDGTVDVVRKIKLVDKRASLDMLAKHVGLYDKDNRQRSGEGGTSVTNAIQITFVNADK